MSTRTNVNSFDEVRRALQSIALRLDTIEAELAVVVVSAAAATSRLDNWSFGPIQDDEGNALLDSDDSEILTNGNIEQWLDRLASIVEGPILDHNDEPITDGADSAIGMADWYLSESDEDETAEALLPATFSTAVT